MLRIGDVVDILLLLIKAVELDVFNHADNFDISVGLWNEARVVVMPDRIDAGGKEILRHTLADNRHSVRGGCVLWAERAAGKKRYLQ